MGPQDGLSDIRVHLHQVATSVKAHCTISRSLYDGKIIPRHASGPS